MIEFAPRSENKLTYNEAILYCKFCDYGGHNGWRMPAFTEYFKIDCTNGWVWYKGKPFLDEILPTSELYVVPVRDI